MLELTEHLFLPSCYAREPEVSQIIESNSEKEVLLMCGYFHYLQHSPPKNMSLTTPSHLGRGCRTCSVPVFVLLVGVLGKGVLEARLDVLSSMCLPTGSAAQKTQSSDVFVHSCEVGKCQKAVSVDHSLHLLTCNCDRCGVGQEERKKTQ